MNKERSKTDIVYKYHKYISPPSKFASFPDDLIVLVEGKGAKVRDIEGNEYIDCFSGVAVLNCGYCHPKIVNVIKEQVEKLVHTSKVVLNIPSILLAEKLVSIAPGKNLNKVLWATGGAEAIEYATIAAKKYTKNTGLIALWGGWHGGSTQLTRMITGYADLRKGSGPYPPQLYSVPSYYCYRCFYELEYPECNLFCAKMLKDVIEFGTTKEIAAFIAEPGLGASGIVPAPKEYFKEVKKILDEYQILFIDDEIQCALGRTGKWWGIQHYGVEPDIVVLGKALGGGLPNAGCILGEEISDTPELEIDSCYTTFTANPICAAAGLATIEVIEEEKLVEKSAKLGDYFLKRLKELQDKYEIIGDVRGKGLWLGVELVKDRQTKEPAKEEARKITEEARKRGVLLSQIFGMYGCGIRIMPSLTITLEQIEQVLDVLDNSFESIMA